MENIFFTFIKPFLNYIDNGHFFRKPFVWLYTIFAILSLLFPVYALIIGIGSDVFKMPAKIIIFFILLLILLALASWIGFQLWWDRKSKIAEISDIGDEYIATPVFAHFILTSGEWLGLFVAIIGFGGSLLALIFLGEDAAYVARQIEIPLLKTGATALISAPITGFIIIVVARFLSEQVRALAAIAQNTKK